MATAPSYFGPIVEKLAAHGLMEQSNDHWRRVVIEKPFGHDLESAKALNQQLLKLADEKQIYRIDHYLGKETVQNIMAFRFANGIFEPIWNRRYIDHVQISVAETVGVEGRGSYFDHAGSMRDMVPNHIMQLISLTAMEPPISFDANAVRDEQAKILHAIQPISDEEVLIRSVRGQYGEGTLGAEHVPAYRAESDVPPDSRTETFVAMKLLIDNWRWADVHRDPVPAGSVCVVPRYFRAAVDAESTGAAHPTGRRHFAAIRGKGAGAGDAAGNGGHEL
jgi:glucose-6-phosphate 1-dehydrogenase